jgi:phenylacetate-CoA ligase
MLSDRCRAFLSQAFSCSVRDSYGAAEVFRIAFECQFQRLHIIPDSAVVEVDESTLDSNGAADIIVTPLYLKTMPLIRYRLGDRVILSEDPCPCGSNFTTIRKIVGRSDDDLTLPSGKRISARAINLLENVPGIVEYQIIQKSRERFEVLVKPGTEYGPDSRRQIEQTIARGCAPEAVQVDVRIVEAVRRTPNGKLNAVISEVH